jgi:hypothetical protein
VERLFLLVKTVLFYTLVIKHFDFKLSKSQKIEKKFLEKLTFVLIGSMGYEVCFSEENFRQFCFVNLEVEDFLLAGPLMRFVTKLKKIKKICLNFIQ